MPVASKTRPLNRCVPRSPSRRPGRSRRRRARRGSRRATRPAGRGRPRRRCRRPAVRRRRTARAGGVGQAEVLDQQLADRRSAEKDWYRSLMAICNSLCNSESTFRDLPLIGFSGSGPAGRMLMMPSTQHSPCRHPRRQPNPVRPLQHRLRRRVEPGHAHRRDRRRWSTRFGLQGERLGEVVAGAVLKHSRDFNLTRESVLGSKLSPETPADRHPAGLRHRPAGGDRRSRTRSRSGRSRSASPAAPTPPPMHRSRSARSCARRCSRSTRAATPRRASPRWPPSGPATSASTIPQNGEPRTGLSMGDHAALTAVEWQVGREEQDELAAASHQKLAAAYDARLPRRPDHAVPRPRARPEPARRLHGREAVDAEAGVRQGRGRDA